MSGPLHHVVVLILLGCALVAPGSALLAEPPPLIEPVRTLAGHAAPVRAVAFSPDGKVVATGGFDRTLRLWDVSTGRELASLRGHGDAHVASADRNPGINSLAFFPGGKTLASGGLDGTVKLWDVAGQKELRTLVGHRNRVLCIAISPDGKTLASASDDRSIRFWDATTGNLTRTLAGHASGVEAVAFDADGEMLVSGSQDGTIKLWSTKEAVQPSTLRGGASVLSVVSSPNLQALAAGFGTGPMALWRLGAKVERYVLEGHERAVHSVSFAPDGKTLASASLDGTVKLWDVAGARKLAGWEAHAKGAWAVCFSPDGKLLASGGSDQTVKLWDVGKLTASSAGQTAPQGIVEPPRAPQPQTGEMECIARIKRLGGRFVATGWRAAWSPDGKRLAFGKTDARGHAHPVLAVIDLETGKTVELASWGKDPAWSPGDSKFIAYVGGGHTSEEIWIVESGGGAPRKIASGGFPTWSVDGKTLFFHDRQKRKLVSVDPFAKEPAGQVKELLDVQDGYAAVDSARTQVACATGGERVAVVDWKSGKTLRTWPIAVNGALGFSPDGKEVAACIANTPPSGGLTFWVLNVATGRGVRVGEGPITLATWSPDGSQLACDVRLGSGWEIWTLDATALARLTVTDLPRDRYTLPEGGTAELVKFISDLKSFRPRSTAEYMRHAQRSQPALLEAAEKILKLEKDKTSEAYQTAARLCLTGRIRAAAQASPQQQQETYALWKEMRVNQSAQELTREDYALGSSLAQALERQGQNELAAEAYRTLASRAAKSADQRMAEMVPTLEGALRRLSLVGKGLELSGTKLDGSPFDWAAYRGKTVLVCFWNSGAAGDRSELACARKHLALYGQRGFDVVGLNLDVNRQRLDLFLEREPQPWVNLFTEGAGLRHPVALRYGVTAVPTMILVGKDGNVLSIQARGAELDRLLEKLLGPPFQPQGKLAFIDLQAQANRRLDERIGRLAENDLRELPPGEQNLAGIRFAVGPKIVFLAGQQFREVPEKVEGIAVNRAFSRLYILHAAAWADVRSGVQDGTLIGQYILRYEDGIKETIPVVCGEDVRNWFHAEGGKPLTRGKVIWTGSNPAARQSQAALNLYLTVWQNPHSEKKVVTLDYVSTMTTAAAPFCVAITAEEAVPGETRPAGK